MLHISFHLGPLRCVVLCCVALRCVGESNEQSRLEGRVRNESAYLYLVFGICSERGMNDRHELTIVFDFQLLIFPLACSARLAVPYFIYNIQAPQKSI